MNQLTKVCSPLNISYSNKSQISESLTIKKAKYQRTVAFELWRSRRLLSVPWTARSYSDNPKGNKP